MRRSVRYEKWILLSICVIILFYYFTKIQNTCSDGQNNNDSLVDAISIREFMSGRSVQIRLPQNDKKIIDYIWENSLLEPLSKNLVRTATKQKNPSKGQGQFIQGLFQNMNAEHWMAKHVQIHFGLKNIWVGRAIKQILVTHLPAIGKSGWYFHDRIGLLVEGDPKNYALMKNSSRQAWISNTCLATKPYPHEVEFVQNFNLGRISDSSMPPKNALSLNKSNKVKVQCLPLFSLLSALNITTVDYFSLDVEGSELQVLKTIPFDKIHIKSLSVEFFHTTEGKNNLLEYMESKGFKKVGEVHDVNQLANDFIFVHENDIDSLSV